MLLLMVVIQIPGPGDILILMLIFFPRLVLTRHFWSDKQRREFFQLEVTKALISGEELLKTYGNSSKSDEQKLKPLDKVDSSESLLLHGLHSMYLLPGSSKRIEKRMEALRVLDNLMPTVIDGFNERQLVFHCYIRKIDIGSKNAAEMRDSLREYTKFTSRMPNNTYLYASALFKQKY
uniref:LETM1 domain-containing protein n=1 Tax=Caenorhabditis japonica TaxID=281687 RepID=A0A8R1DZT7_CAEJA